ncbi:MAG: TonB-dependent receptor [Proteiniphilum sp.]|uniref:SusC/RagA family TonB-linked outer membrane protein n=1 Tax=Proteiniphilum sp. TaxID=1926877 RepID=UPI002B1F1EF4|nr:TonB-dependent receptor [Proteiniphilum sp.]MEA5127460.1 TonB-dependent receptor [Proteiniphilum sp.]
MINFKKHVLPEQYTAKQRINERRKRRLLCICLLLVIMLPVFGQQHTITGIITDINGETVIGASIQEKGTTNGTITNVDGQFTLLVQPDAVLVVSYIGYRTQEIAAVFNRTIHITLEEATETLEEVVVVGYGVQKKATLSGSVTSVRGDDIVNAPVMNVSNSLAGRMPGVVAISNNSEPGYDGATLRIRGVNTFGKSDPLIVVDGVPGRSLERIDPASIETISVMKDASAAIYGAQAANGVILITTKRGKKGRPTVDLSLNYGLSRPTSIPKMADAAEYGILLNEIDRYAGREERYSAEDIQKFRDGSDPWLYPNTDWFDETLKPWSPQTNLNTIIEGGTDNVNYFVSLSGKYQDGIYRNSATNYHQYDLRINLDWKINDNIDIYLNTSGRMEDRNYPTRSAENVFRMLMRSKPNMPAYWPNGMPGPDIEFGDNPVVIVTDATGYDRDKRYVVNGDIGMNIKIPQVDGLTLKGTASLDKNFRFRKIWQTPWYLYAWDGVSQDSNGEPILTEGKKGFSDPRLRENMEDNHSILLSGLLNYNKIFAQSHTMNAMAGVERISGGGDNFEAYRRYYISTAIDQLFAGGQDEINNTGSAYKEARLNYFGRLNYSYKSKYLAEFVWRYQGSYIFDKSNKFGFFPGVSLGYVLSEEKYWETIKPIISFVKLRTSWGQTGNDMIDPYQYLASYVFNNIMYITNGGTAYNQALREGVAPNSDVTWETATQQNVGLDMQFLNGDLALTIDYFLNKRKDILWKRNASVPNTSGLSLPDENLGRVKNQGVDFSIDYRKRFEKITLGIGLNGVYSKNKILFWDEAPGVPDYQRSTGRPIGAGLYYRAIGIFKDEAHVNSLPHWAGARPGDIIFEDYNEDGVIDGNDRVRYDKSRTPTFTGGLSIDLGYRGFDLSILFQGAAGGVFQQTTESGDFGNFLKSFYDKRWTEDNPNTEFPRTYNRSNEYWVNQPNTFWLHKTDYIRLKNIELGYTLPKMMVNQVKIENVRFYINAYNLLTFSPDMKDYDPENTSGSGYNHPLNKIINVGINVTF